MYQAQFWMDYTLKMYGDASVKYAKTGEPVDYDMMVIWQNKVWMAAKNLAEAQETAEV